MLANAYTPTSVTTPVKAAKISGDGLSPVSIFANLDQQDSTTPVKKQQPADRALRKETSKAKADHRAQLWSTVEEETDGDWDAMHAVLKAQLKGKVALDWAIPEVTKTIVTAAPPTPDDFAKLNETLSAHLAKRKELLTSRRGDLSKKSFTEEEKEGLEHEFGVRCTAESVRWSQITCDLGSNQLLFPVQNTQCEFNPKQPSLRNISFGAPAGKRGECTAEEMKAGTWGIEHKVLAPCDANGVTFNLRRREVTADDKIDTTAAFSSALSFQVNPGEKGALRSFLLHSRMQVLLTESDKQAGVWGIEHRSLEARDVNDLPFPLVNSAYEENIGAAGDAYGTNAEDFTEKTPSVVSDAASLRDSVHSDDTEIYSESDAVSAGWGLSLPSSPLTEEESMFFEKGWANTIAEARAGEALDTTTDENRLCQWKYFARTDLIASDKTLKCQDDVWVARKTRGALSPTSIRGRIRRLAARFGGKRVESFWSGLRDENFTLDVVKVALPEEREAKLAALRVQEQQVLEAREVKKHKIFQHRLSKIAFYTSPKAVEDLLRKKDDHFMRPRTFKYVPQRTQVEALTLQSNFFLHFLKVKNDYVQETKQDDVSGDFKEQQEHRVDSQRRARYESTEEVAL